MQKNIKNRTIFCDDNLDIMYGFDTESIDLIYLDPPFNKKKIFTAPIGSSAEGASFPDIFGEEDVKEEWLKTIKEDYFSLHELLSAIKNIEGRASSSFCYLAYMAVRLMECHRILKDTGNIYLHCDSTMSHYLKLLLDCIFEKKNFRNEIVWQRNDCRAKGSQFSSKKYGVNTDVILFYTKSNHYHLDANIEWMSDAEITRKFNKVDESGRRYYTGIPIFRSKSMGARPNLCYEWRGFKNPHPSGWRLSKEKLEEEYQKGNIVIRDNSTLERRKYFSDYRGKVLDNNWVDIPRVGSTERIGYPTQKPLALLERIIKASSNEGDTVLDPFCGCATTCVAAERLGRQWIGIDVSKKAYELVKERLELEVEWKGSLFEESLVTFRTDPPNRTDSGKDYIQKKSVYILFHPKHKGYKVGVASDVKSRLNSYQTGDPKRQYQLKYSLLTPYFREIEKYIHDKYENTYEWVMGDLEVIKKDIEAKHEALDRS